MGLLILIIGGCLTGWLATIALQIESGRDIARNIFAGVAGSLGVGLIVSGGVFLGALPASTLLWAAAGSILAVGLYNFVRHRVTS